MPDLDQTPRLSIEHGPEDGDEEEKEEIDYDIEWKVLMDKEPIIGDLIRRSDFRLNSLCLQAKGKAQDRANSKDKDV